jgi:hypothetical protein
MAKKRSATKKAVEPEVEKVVYPPGTTLYCWKFNHPKVGWCGGHDDDHWEEKESIILDRMAYCPYETELISKVVQ